MDKQIGDLIKNIRKRNGLTQQQLSDLIPFSREIISKIENNTRIPTTDFLLHIRDILQFDFLTLYKNLDDFKNLEHYILYYKITMAIENADFSNMYNFTLNTTFI